MGSGAWQVSGLLTVSCLLCGAGAVAAGKPTYVIGRFDSADELKKWSTGDSGAAEVSVEPRTATDRNKMMKMVALSGSYPGVTTRPPRDWSPYEAFSFVVWSPSTYGINIRIDDVRSKNYATRYNHGIKVEKGRTLVQIPVKDIAKAIDVEKVKTLILFTSRPPKGFTLWFDDILLGPVQAEKVDFIPYEDRMDIIPSTEVVTPHLPVAKNLAGGPLKLFVLGGAENGREVVEVMQRVDVDLSLVTWDRNWRRDTWGFGDFYGDRTQNRNHVLLQKYLASSMQGPEKFEALILPTPLGWNRFGKGARESIVDRVKNRGEGLVLVFPYTGEADWEWPDDLRGLSPLVDSESDYMASGGTMRFARSGRLFDRKWRITKKHPITDGVPVHALPLSHMEVQRYKVADGAEVLVETHKGEPVLAVKSVGRGRVATFAVRSHMITPFFNIPRDVSNPLGYRYWEISYSLLARTALWAAGRRFKRQGDAVTLTVTGPNADECLTVRQWKDAAGRVTDWELVHAPKAGPADIEVSVPIAVSPGEGIPVRFNVPSQYRDRRCVISLGEKAFGRTRTLERFDVELSELERSGEGYSIELPTERVRRYVAWVAVACGDEGSLAFGETDVIVTPPPTWTDYEIYTWVDYGLPFLRDFEEGLMREFGITANLIGSRDHRSMRRQLRAGLRVVAYGFTAGMHIRDYGEVVRQYQLTGDGKYLVRRPSYNDDEFLASERRKTSETCAKIVPYAPISMIMSDETSLTSYRNEFDFDLHPNNVEKFVAKMKGKFGGTGALNAALGTEVDSFDALRPPTTGEARKAGNFGLWNEWRAHNDDQWALAFKFYGDAMKEKYAHARLSVSGTQTSHVFNGIDWGKMTRHFDAMSDYTGRFQLRKRLSFHPEGLKSTPWVGYGRSGRAVDYQLWSNLTFDGDGAAIFWWYSLRNPDLTWCSSAKDYMRVFKELKAGIGMQFQLTKRRFSPVAICWSPNSQRAAWTLGKYGDFEKAERTVVKTLVGAGYDPFFVTETDIAEGGLGRRGARALALPMTISMGTGRKRGGLAVLPQLRKFVDGGGSVLATHEVRFDEFLRPARLPAAVTGKFIRFTDDAGRTRSALVSRGVRPHVEMATVGGGPVKSMSASVHGFPGYDNARVITLLRAPVGTREEVGADGVIHMVPDPEGGREVEKVELDVSAFGGARFYDIRRGRAVECRAGKLTVAMRAGDGLPIAALDYAPVRFVPGATGVERRDRTLSVAWKLAAGAGNGQLPPHVVRIDVIDGATGKVDARLSANRVTGRDGHGELHIPLAFEDEGRELEVRIRDVLTGTVWVHPGTADAARRKPRERPGPDESAVGGPPAPGSARRDNSRGPEVTARQARPVGRPDDAAGPSTTVMVLAAGILVVAVAYLARAALGKKRRRRR